MSGWRYGWCLTCGLLLVSGCGSPANTPDAPQGTSTVSFTPPPADAAAAVTALAAAMRDGKVEQAYDLLPASYQSDVDRLVHEFAGQMDPEIWSAGFGVLGKATGLLKAKKDLLLSMADQPGKEAQTEKLAANWDGLVSGLEKFVASDLSEVDRLKSRSARELLQAGVGPLAKVLVSMATVNSQDGAATPATSVTAADFDKVKAEVLEATDSTATVKITSPAKAEPEIVEFAKVEGKWIPKTMADTWAENISKAREQIKAIDPDAISAQKPKILQMVTTMNGVLDQMMKAEKPEEIQAAMAPLFVQAMMMGLPLGGNAKPQTKATNRPSGRVTLIVTQTLSAEDQEKLEVAIKELIDDSSMRKITTTKVNGRTILSVSPVADIDAFAKKLTVAKELEIDTDKNVITIEKIEFE